MRKLYALLLAAVLVFSVTGTALAVETKAPLSGAVTRTDDVLALALTAEQINVSGTLTLWYDPAVLTFKEVETAGTLDSLQTSSDSVTFGYAMETSQAAQAGDVVVTVYFTVMSQEPSMVDVRVENWNEQDGQDRYVSVSTVEGEPRFRDVPTSAWFCEEVEYVAQRGMMNGMGNRLFAPNGTMTRAMLVTVLGRMAGVQPGEYTTSSFKDVKDGAWYSTYVAWAERNGITNGISPDSFAPNHPVTREQAATMMYRYAQWAGCDVQADRWALEQFNDYKTVSHYATDAMAWATQTGILVGYNHLLTPCASTTRAQGATMMMRLDLLLG